MELLQGDGGFLQAMTLAVLLSAIPLGASMAIGLVVSILQAATQIQEQTLSFVPKIAVVTLVLFFGGQWMSKQVIDYFVELLNSLPTISANM